MQHPLFPDEFEVFDPKEDDEDDEFVEDFGPVRDDRDDPRGFANQQEDPRGNDYDDDGYSYDDDNSHSADDADSAGEGEVCCCLDPIDPRDGPECPEKPAGFGLKTDNGTGSVNIARYLALNSSFLT